MTTETAVHPNITREERLFAHLMEQMEAAKEQGGDWQFLVDFKFSNGRLVGEAVVDVKHRFDLQGKC